MKLQFQSQSLKVSQFIRSEPIVKSTYIQIQRAWRAAAREFFKEAARLIAIDTGMSAASLLPLARKVQIGSEIESIINNRAGGFPKAKKGYYTISGEWVGSGIRSRTQGVREAEKRLGNKLIIDLGNVNNPKLVFRFEIVIHQWSVKEDAWNVLAPARQAFIETYSVEIQNRVRVEDVYRYMRTARVTVRGTN